MKHLCLIVLLILLLTSSCMQPATSLSEPSLLLNSFTANDVTVILRLDMNSQGETFLSATYIPPDGYHLYSKDIPMQGLDGLGRPTLLELPSGSHLKTSGQLIESVAPQVPDFEPKELFVYPEGKVTLRLQVLLPENEEWLDDAVTVTYMACSNHLCKPPVVGKVVAIRIPSVEAFNTPQE